VGHQSRWRIAWARKRRTGQERVAGAELDEFAPGVASREAPARSGVAATAGGTGGRGDHLPDSQPLHAQPRPREGRGDCLPGDCRRSQGDVGGGGSSPRWRGAVANWGSISNWLSGIGLRLSRRRVRHFATVPGTWQTTCPDAPLEIVPLPEQAQTRVAHGSGASIPRRGGITDPGSVDMPLR
jgi:hypothetical protein